MYRVSDRYKAESRQTIRNQSTVKASLNVEDPDAKYASEFTDNGHLKYSRVENLKSIDASTSMEYATLEHNRFVLDGSFALLPESNYTEQGYVCSAVSDSSGNFVREPSIEITFSDYFSFVGLTIDFSDHFSDYPTSVGVKGYLDDSLVYARSVSVGSYELVVDEHIPAEGKYLNKLVLSFNNTLVPLRRVRVKSVTFGLKYDFDNDVISTAEWNREISLISTELPTEELRLSIIDVDKKFDPENIHGPYSFLHERQSVKASIGYELNNALIEWMPVGSMLTTSSFNVDAQSNIPILNIEAKSSLLSLTELWTKGVYNDAATLYDLAAEMLEGATQVRPMYKLDETLKQYYTLYPLPKDSIRNNLQLIANAGMCVLYTDRNGAICIQRTDRFTDMQDYELSFNDLYTAPATTKYPVLSTVTVGYSEVYVNSVDTVQLYSEAVNVRDGETWVSIEYELSRGQTVETTGSVVVKDSRFYAEGCELLISGTGSVIINGNRITVNKRSIRKMYNRNGEDCPFENPLITFTEHAQEYADWIAAFEMRRNEYEFQDRGYPELDMADRITIETAFTPKANVQVVKHNITFDGAISGETKCIIE